MDKLPPPWRLTRAMRAQLRDRPLLRDRYERMWRQQQTANESALREPEARSLETAWKNSEKDK